MSVIYTMPELRSKTARTTVVALILGVLMGL